MAFTPRASGLSPQGALVGVERTLVRAGSKAKRLCGRTLAAALETTWRARAAALQGQRGRPVGLGVLLVGEDPASALYVRNKEKAAARVGFASRIVRLRATASKSDVERAIDSFNDDPHIDAFLLQLPLPTHLQAEAAALVARIAPNKDADGLHPYNVGQAAFGAARLRPCTPQGCMKLIEAAGVAPAGKRAVVIGRSHIVGQPMALMLSQADATVTLCHQRSVAIYEDVRQADIVVSATGVPHLVKGHWLKPGACVIDVGIVRRVGEDGKAQLFGDVDYDAALHVASAITPVPGGVGPMTIAMLLYNALLAAEQT